MARVIAVPGLAVRAYVAPPVQHLRNHGYDATLLQPPAWRGVDQDLALYGRRLAADIDNDGAPVDVLIGLSAGSQAAAVAASLTSLVSRLVLVSPTVDPAYRSMIKQLYVFVRVIRTTTRPFTTMCRIGPGPAFHASSVVSPQPSPCILRTSCRE
jgi:pimeloyl-ACP methyl ester carboxylesterase